MDTNNKRKYLKWVKLKRKAWMKVKLSRYTNSDVDLRLKKIL